MTKTWDNITSEIRLEKVQQEKDLGVITEQHLTFEEHLTTKTNKANQMMVLIRRSFHHLNIETFRWLYQALVRPHMEYAQAAWSPMRKKDIITLENVQRRATKLIPGFRDLPYHERLRRIDLPTLSYRRLRGDMVELYKINSGMNDPDVSIRLSKHEGPTRGNQQKLYKERCTTKRRQSQFKIRVVEPWNSIPDQIVRAPSLKSFERRLDKFWADQDIRFNYEATLNTSSRRELCSLM